MGRTKRTRNGHKRATQGKPRGEQRLSTKVWVEIVKAIRQLKVQAA